MASETYVIACSLCEEKLKRWSDCILILPRGSDPRNARAVCYPCIEYLLQSLGRRIVNSVRSRVERGPIEIPCCAARAEKPDSPHDPHCYLMQ